MNDPSEYVRQIETYLCRKNGGHLVRVVGPAFELVRGWASQGVPLKIAFKGIDRCCERRQVVGVRRRPVRIEFCEADVLGAFDDWRRAVGVTGVVDATEGDDESEPAARKPALAAHIERGIARLVHARGGGAADSALRRTIDEIVRELETAAGSAVKARGDARAEIVARLREMDARLIAEAIQAQTSDRAAALRNEAEEELAAFGARMSPDAHARAVQSAFERILREMLGLPTLTYD